MMTRPIAKSFLIIFLVATAIGVLISVKSLLMPTRYYPYLEIGLPGNASIKILQRGQVQPSQCARSLANQVTTITGICPSCRIETSECQTDIGNIKQLWLNDDPLASPSARMAYGVIVFESPPQHQIALAMCMESERQSLSNTIPSRVKCFPAGVKRPFQSTEQEILLLEHAEWQKSLVVSVTPIIGLIALFVASLALLRRFAVREPTEEASVEIESDQAIAVKLSNILKRVVDMLLAVTLLIVLLPILLLFALLIRILEGSPIFYISHRVISHDNTVSIYKFRTMVRDATSPKYRLNERYMRDGFLDIPLECEVYTPIGRVLERTQIVETLQLLNILFDGMSFVGNRPLPKNNIELLKKFRGWEERFYSPAGITGISQIVGKYGLLPQQRLYLERMYSNIFVNPNGNILLCDLSIIGCTILLLLTGRYLEYDKAVALLIRCGADKDLPAYFPLDLVTNITNNE